MQATPEKKKQTRLEQLKASGATDSDIDMPQVTLTGLVKLLLEQISPALQNGMGLTPLSWQEINSFIVANDFPLNAFELRVIKNASKAYVNMSLLATNPKCPPPHRIIKRDPMKLAEHIKNVFS